jgi:hypothetical protein
VTDWTFKKREGESLYVHAEATATMPVEASEKVDESDAK